MGALAPVQFQSCSGVIGTEYCIYKKGRKGGGKGWGRDEGTE